MDNQNILKKRLDVTIMANRIIKENHYVIEQPCVQGIIDILNHVMLADSDIDIRIGQVVTGDKISQIFKREPRTEGINFCTKTKKLYVITKIGSDNQTVVDAEYNDYWRMGKIYYEGRGQDEFQKMTDSNLHLYRKYQVFHNKIKCKEGVEPYIHVFNKTINEEKNHFQYLGRFDVTDFQINEHSIGSHHTNQNRTKKAVIFELTPLCSKSSPDIDKNYII